jgi:hypothetical protein
VTRVSHALDRIDATFDDPNQVADTGLLLVATLSQRLGLETLIDATVRLDGRVGGAYVWTRRGGSGDALRGAGYDPLLVAEERLQAGSKFVWVEAFRVA